MSTLVVGKTRATTEYTTNLFLINRGERKLHRQPVRFTQILKKDLSWLKWWNLTTSKSLAQKHKLRSVVTGELAVYFSLLILCKYHIQNKIIKFFYRFPFISWCFQNHTTVEHNTIQYSTVQHNTTQYIPLISRVRGPYGKLWTEFFPSFYGPSAKRAGHENKEGKNEDP